jgi:hypothetical protein
MIGKFIGGFLIAPVQGIITQDLTNIEPLCRVNTNNEHVRLFRTSIPKNITTIKLEFIGNADFRFYKSAEDSVLLNWPLKAFCSNSDELMDYMKQHINDIFKECSFKTVELQGHSLGGAAALNMAKYIQENYPDITISNVSTINSFTSICETIKQGQFFGFTQFIMSLLVALIALSILGIGNSLFVTVAYTIISNYIPSLVYLPAGSLIRMCGWEMDNQKIATELKGKGIKIIHLQAVNDELIQGNAQFQNAQKIQGTHNRFFPNEVEQKIKTITRQKIA